MTRDQIQQLHTLLVRAQTGEDWGPVNDAALILDAELALPEAREWRVTPIGNTSGNRLSSYPVESMTEAQAVAAELSSFRCVIESRTPAGQWEAA